ncbi:MAG: fluoride efflux transporter CrcB [Bacillota bacterium]
MKRETNMLRLAIVSLGGAMGAGARYWVTGVVQKAAGAEFPWGTAVVNLIGSFLIGFVMTFGTEISSMPTETRLFLVTGILGGLTTFSALGYETVRLIQEGSLFPAIGNVALNLIVGLVAVATGIFMARAY